MSWLKEVIVDIAVTIFIIASVWLADPWMKYIIWAYTGIMLLTKSIVLFSDNFMQIAKKAKNTAPEWFAHLLYATNTFVLFYFTWWYAAAGWLLIWLFSFLTQRKLNQRKGT